MTQEKTPSSKPQTVRDEAKKKTIEAKQNTPPVSQLSNGEFTKPRFKPTKIPFSTVQRVWSRPAVAAKHRFGPSS